MGRGISKEREERNREIDRQIAVDRQKDEMVIKLLLLGSGDSGKSTVLKQMRILHDNGFSEEEVRQRKLIVYSNTITAMSVILNAMNKLNIALGAKELMEDAKLVQHIVASEQTAEPFTDQLFTALKRLWADQGVQECFEKGGASQLDDSADYFLNAIDRIHQTDYMPNYQDILRTRVNTVGINELSLTVNQWQLRVSDVGGQRSERKKWIHCFDNVHAVLFVTSLSEYDQILYEDSTTNRMRESLRLFDTVINSRWFSRAAIVLFLNKTDLFASKLTKNSIKVALPDYDGPNTYESSVNYIRQQFEAKNYDPKKKIYTHETCATDITHCEFVLNSVLDMLFNKVLKNVGFPA